ncbi:hypothetical protein VNO80_03628 [Phaseolus coccineus]|uniref:Uncharacterized protein n=1 Tax=Phaseolus coccineus TaxID=3886 RepID=A0AAN9NTI5_PHACN
MAKLGGFEAQFCIAVMILSMFYVTKIVAQESAIAPTSQMETGAGSAFSVSEVTLYSSVLASVVAFMMQ